MRGWVLGLAPWWCCWRCWLWFSGDQTWCVLAVAGAHVQQQAIVTMCPPHAQGHVAGAAPVAACCVVFVHAVVCRA